ncbi:MAG: aldehyde dehydrogenase family protein [Zoogloeaceae bacterium]|jgi:acyl-CoA reductase-like NAD-dependent aldehyde dehydrogenase|nr:aldehyde dehydrogenase family protein [Zoogloeaceae bacterium]
MSDRSAYALYIDGTPERARDAFPVINPATEETISDAPRASRAQVEAAVEAAHRAQKPWGADEDARRLALAGAAVRLAAHQEEIARLITLEQGRPLKFALGEAAGAVAILRQYAELPLEPGELTLRDDAERLVRVERRPFGVVAAITPWNVPIILLALKLAPALLAGNTVVAKPSEYTPLSTLRLAEIIGPEFPPGVFNVVSGAGETGQILAEHPLVKNIAFTGSVATGRRIFSGAANDFKRFTLELGGNDPALVLEDADPAAIAEKIFWGAFWNSGQICFAIKRLYVPERLAPALVAALSARARRTVVGNGLDEKTELGPLSNSVQFERVRKLVDDARLQGARVHAGGGPLAGPGYFYPPTIIGDVDNGVALVDEEQFGPVLPVVVYTRLEEALRKINANVYGLGASVWTADSERGHAVLREIDVGLGWVNDHQNLHPGAPKGGFKWSGFGYEGGRQGLEAYSQLQTVNVNRALPVSQGESP